MPANNDSPLPNAFPASAQKESLASGLFFRLLSLINWMGLVALEEVAGVDAGADVVEDGVVAVGDDGVGEGFEAVEVVDDAAAEEG